MATGPHIRAVGPQADKAEPAGEQDALLDDHLEEAEQDTLDDGDLDLSDYLEAEPYEERKPSREWIAPTLAGAVLLAWTGLYVWALQDQLAGAASASPTEWVRWIVDWSVPVLLIGIVWLLAMRTSRVEANRFARTASLLSQESSELENRLTVVNRELSLAREFLGAQSRELESLGRIASERLSTHASQLQSLIKDNGAQVDAIGTASETALGNMTRLRDDLPVVANSARDVSNQVGNAGRTAQDQLESLVSGFERLNQFGKASENQVGAFETRVTQSLSGFETQLARVGDLISNRFENVRTQTGSYRDEIDEAEKSAVASLNERMAMLQSETKAISDSIREAEITAMQQLQHSKERFTKDLIKTVDRLDQLDAQAMAASQRRMENLHQQACRFDDQWAARDRSFIEETSRRQEEFETREAQASEQLAQRLVDLDDALAQRREAQIEEIEGLVKQSADLETQVERLSNLIGEVTDKSETARTSLAADLDGFGETVAAKQAVLTETKEQLEELTESGVRLLEIIQSGARHSREDLPSSIETASEALSGLETRSTDLSSLMFTASDKAENLDQYLIDTQSKIEQTNSSIEELQIRLAEQSEDTLAKLAGLRGAVSQLSLQSGELADGAQDQLRIAIVELEAATRSAFTSLDEGARERVQGLAASVSQEAVSGIEASLEQDTAKAIERIQQAATQASEAGRETTKQLRDQLAKVNELTLNLEQRIARARELSEEQIGSDFSQRMALITDSLNSNAIDIASALSTEVSDIAWDAYLKGDRGIFTRRAVSLIDNGEAKEIGDLYKADEEFKANVSRYIHDFEAMLRSMLSTRDGNALSVTVLGSDMGKLYVALAQGIERFRQ